MTIDTHYRFSNLEPDGKRYVRAYHNGSYFWGETGFPSRGGSRYDIAQGTCEHGDLPPDVAQAALDRRGMWPPYVEWPL